MRQGAIQMIQLAERLRDEVDQLTFGPPVVHVYNPLRYAWAAHRQYLARYGEGRKQVLFLGMNPGPFGMAQTGIPFGEVGWVRDWLKIQCPVDRPPAEHPKRPVLGFDCPRSEVSGKRLWGLFAAEFKSADAFFARHFVVNYCPLVFIEAGGCNRTPDKLPARELTPLLEVCDWHLREVVRLANPEWLVGIGRFAERRARVLFGGSTIKIAPIPHPSPASPASNRDWQGSAKDQLRNLGIW